MRFCNRLVLVVGVFMTVKTLNNRTAEGDPYQDKSQVS